MKILFPLSLFLLCLTIGGIGLQVASTTNLDTEPYDQGAYLGMAAKLRDAPYPSTTDGTRNALFPWFSARLFHPESPDFFLRGKQMNVILATLGCLVLGWVGWRRLGGWSAWNFAALSGLGCLLPMSVFFGAEVMFYLLMFAAWVLALRFLRRPGWMTAFALGLVSGLAYLAKPSNLPFLALFGGFVFSLGTIALLRPGRFVPARWNTMKGWAGLLLCLAAFTALISPRLAMAKETFGSPLYNLPGFWFWADDWAICVEKYSDCTPHAIAAMPESERPTPANYLRRNGWQGAWQRLSTGTYLKIQQLVSPDRKPPWKKEKRGKPRIQILPHRGWYLVAYGLLALGILIGSKNLSARQPDIAWPLAFGICTFTLYTLAYGWYHPIGPGHRFIMMFYVPLLWSFLIAANSFRQSPRRVVISETEQLHLPTLPFDRIALGTLNLAVSTLLIWRLTGLALGPNFGKISYAF